MASKRMINREVIEQLDFEELNKAVRLVYVYLILYADDDGFVTNPAKVGATKKSLTELEKAGFIYCFKRGIVLIRHWFEHNTIRKDMYKPTRYTEEKALVMLDNNKIYQKISVTEPVKVREKVAPQIREDQIKEDQIKEDQIKEDQIREDQIKEEQGRVEKGNSDQTVASATSACGASFDDKERNFELFWNLYPNKCDKERAKAKFMSLDVDFDTIMEGLQYHLKCHQWVSDNGYFVQKPYTWLHNQLWQDRPPLHVEKPPAGASGGLGEEEKRAIRLALLEEG